MVPIKSPRNVAATNAAMLFIAKIDVDVLTKRPLTISPGAI
jgi:hypothetical protein